MIGKLKGVIDSYGEDYIILDVHGVGYVVQCSSTTLQRLPPVGEAAVVSIETQVREDAIRLFGFLSDNDREWFRLLQSVQGVGAKVALAILSVLDPGALATAIATADKHAIARSPGVGPKLAQRICIELKDKAPAFSNVDPALVRLSDSLEENTASHAVADAVSGLVNLGYPRAQASAAVAAALKQAGEEAEAKTLIRLGLRELAR
ncbi:Holliday junction branch migration protein RuvA [Microvirga sp. W0021]|uniref:Holliday junction branch migration complex subunit RuvA n=1 Tax=Hohaiivirga grylli TaxID=3133970 RepID=A0ABV0BJN9_9HYPH